MAASTISAHRWWSIMVEHIECERERQSPAGKNEWRGEGWSRVRGKASDAMRGIESEEG
jgi:hypothetical protein